MRINVEYATYRSSNAISFFTDFKEMNGKLPLRFLHKDIEHLALAVYEVTDQIDLYVFTDHYQWEMRNRLNGDEARKAKILQLLGQMNRMDKYIIDYVNPELIYDYQTKKALKPFYIFPPNKEIKNVMGMASDGSLFKCYQSSGYSTMAFVAYDTNQLLAHRDSSGLEHVVHLYEKFYDLSPVSNYLLNQADVYSDATYVIDERKTEYLENAIAKKIYAKKNERQQSPFELEEDAEDPVPWEYETNVEQTVINQIRQGLVKDGAGTPIPLFPLPQETPKEIIVQPVQTEQTPIHKKDERIWYLSEIVEGKGPDDPLDYIEIDMNLGFNIKRARWQGRYLVLITNDTTISQGEVYEMLGIYNVILIKEKE